MSSLISLAFIIGFAHTIIGVDHYLPFASLSIARKWSLTKTLSITFICGIGHVLASVLIGLFGLSFGKSISAILELERFRGGVALWALIIFGLLYAVWGYRSRMRGLAPPSGVATLGLLFSLFVLGPCEPLIPFLIFPASTFSATAIVAVILSFSLGTVVTMMAGVALVRQGAHLIPSSVRGRFGHSMAGITIAAAGLSVLLFGI